MRTAASAPATAGPSRDLRLDFFRGVALICIFIDHIPENYLNYFTLSAVGFFDAAEVFIFISGFTAALVYGRTLAARGVLIATVQVLRRAWQLYVAHIFLFMIFIAEVSYTVKTFNNPMYNEEMGVGDFLEHPHIAVVQAMLLQFQPTFLDILPLYIVMLLIFPAVLVCLRRHPMVALIPSALIYLEVQIFNVDMPAYPAGSVWTFNPLAWQLLFVLGAMLGQAEDAVRERAAAAGARLLAGARDRRRDAGDPAELDVSRHLGIGARVVRASALAAQQGQFVADPPRLVLRGRHARGPLGVAASPLHAHGGRAASGVVRPAFARNLLSEHPFIGARPFSAVGNQCRVHYAAGGECRRHRGSVPDGRHARLV